MPGNCLTDDDDGGWIDVVTGRQERLLGSHGYDRWFDVLGKGSHDACANELDGDGRRGGLIYCRDSTAEIPL